MTIVTILVAVAAVILIRGALYSHTAWGAMGCMVLLAMVVSTYTTAAAAEDVKIVWTNPTTDCTGTTLAPGTLTAIELYVHNQTMPGRSQPACGGGPTILPEGLPTPIAISPSPETHTFDLEPGDYYVRMRIQGQGHGWSVLSNELAFTVLPAEPNRPNAPQILEFN